MIAELPAGKLEPGEDHRLADSAGAGARRWACLLREADLPGLPLLLPGASPRGCLHIYLAQGADCRGLPPRRGRVPRRGAHLPFSRPGGAGHDRGDPRTRRPWRLVLKAKALLGL
ncbi:MAG: hypothetical protein ACLRWQ_10455 [Flavonifractor plautii]